MTTSPVVSVTDELVAELGQYSGVPAIAALLAERAELKRDAERYRHIRANGIPGPAIAMQDSYYGELELVSPDRLDAAIDAAMQK